jgi:hypothetical protein
MNENSLTDSDLVLGWQVSNMWEPLFWLTPKVKVGTQKANDLVCVPPNSLGCHTAIIAQSGSGKSFFLARLIEEIVLKTKARCVILDPNADFKKIYEVENLKLWKKASYDMHKRKGKLPHEPSKKEFFDKWSNVQIKVNSRSFQYDLNKNQELLKLYWPSVSVEFIAEDSDPIIRSALYHCHAFTASIYLLVLLKNGLKNHVIRKTFIKESERIFRMANALKSNDISQAFNEYDESVLSKSSITLDSSLSQQENERAIRWAVRRAKNRAQTAVKYMSDEVAKFYFGKVQEYSDAGILKTALNNQRQPEVRVEVVDLPSITDKRTRLLVINSILSEEWDYAQKNWNIALEKNIEDDNRVPTFIIIDEAHNLIPSEPRNQAEFALREQFRTIISEGRKYGLYLIIASQRPDKLDPLILSECDNKAIMKLSSESVIDLTKKLLSLDGVSNKLLEQTLTFETGRGILIGKWAANNSVPFYSAARRTIEGGRNLRDEHWASPYTPSPEAETAIPIKGPQKSTVKKTTLKKPISKLRKKKVVDK